MTIAFVPRPIAELPWRMLWIVLGLAAIGAVSRSTRSRRPGRVVLAVRDAPRDPLRHVLPGHGDRHVLRPARSDQAGRRFAAYAGCILLLILVMALGVVGGGARSWLDLGPSGSSPQS